jgi:hypothetical protein
MEALRHLSSLDLPAGLLKVKWASHTVTRGLRNAACGAGLFALLLSSAWAGGDEPILQPSAIASTVPANGDLNPYGIAFVPSGVPSWSTLKPGDVVVSNFNGKSNVQGTGTTIVKIVANSNPVTFFEGHDLGLTTALTVLRSGFVLVGNLPTENKGTTIESGSLLVINPQGRLVKELKNPTLLNGPWDLAVIDHGHRITAFVSNVLSGTVARLDLTISDDGVVTMLPSSLIIASGYMHGTDPAALVVGPTGLTYDSIRDVLYVASTADNAVFAIYGAASATHNGGVGRLIYQDNVHLHGPLALALAPNGHLVTSNGDAVNPDPRQPSEIVEFTHEGRFVGQMQVDLAPGSAFGLAFGLSSSGQLQFGAVDDNTNTATVWTLRTGDNN